MVRMKGGLKNEIEVSCLRGGLGWDGMEGGLVSSEIHVQGFDRAVGGTGNRWTSFRRSAR